jgi:hypothetical protein
MAALPGLPEVEASVRTLAGTVYGDPLRPPAFVLITPGRAYRITPELELDVRLEADATASPDGYSATLEGEGIGTLFSASRITLRVPPARHAQVAARLNGWYRDECRARLRQLQSAVEQWALDRGKPASARPPLAEVVGPKRYLSRMPHCPSGGTYQLRTVEQGPICSVPGHTLEE